MPCWWNAIHSGHFADAGDILPHSKSITAPALSMTSVPSRSAASVGSEHTGNAWLNSRPFSTKETECCLLMSRISAVTPYGFIVVTRTSSLDKPRCSIDRLKPVSKIRILDIPSISSEIVGVPCSNKTESEDFMTPFSRALRWKKWSSFSLSPFPNSSFPF